MAQKESSSKLIRDYGLAALLAVLIALFIRFFVIEAYRIPSQAMRPTLEAGDTVFVAKSTYGLRTPWSTKPFSAGRMPHYGEVVIFSFPDEPRKDFIKRVVGLPGDTVELKKGKLLLNGKPVTIETSSKSLCGEEKIPTPSGSPLVRYPVCWEPPHLELTKPMLIGENQIFVVGDARSEFPEYKPAKNWALVPLSSLKGRALWVWLSIDPQGDRAPSSWFSRVRFERMFRPIN
ncbi:MAG: signal peptidase I [Methylotenera sp.]|nr:signal peptidase I [Oligoflexia bacterium]